jgi:hypothetical protein
MRHKSENAEARACRPRYKGFVLAALVGMEPAPDQRQSGALL